MAAVATLRCPAAEADAATRRRLRRAGLLEGGAVHPRAAAPDRRRGRSADADDLWREIGMFSARLA